jgi:hypothetical protein
MEGTKPQYTLIPLSEITDNARKLAVVWVEELQDTGGSMIQQKHKLASDIMNYAKVYHQAQNGTIKLGLADLEKAIDRLDMLDTVKTFCKKAVQLVFLEEFNNTTK